VRFHLDDQDGGRDDARRNIDAWWPAIAAGTVEAIVVTASGCGVQVKDYGHLLKDDRRYADKAARVSALCRDVAEVLGAEAARLEPLAAAAGRPRRRIAFHAPCSLQHGQKIRGVVEALLGAAGFELVPVRDGHLCCGSAGTYSLLQPEISAVCVTTSSMPCRGGAESIVSANIGCIEHLAARPTTCPALGRAPLMMKMSRKRPESPKGPLVRKI
jgi:glycolate oxidase iron-sulfur subunit